MEEVSGTMPEGVKELEVCLPVKEVEEREGKGKAEGFFQCLDILTRRTNSL